ncbi:MAG: hypothetical protein ACKVQC_04490 [Elusimicrobiota bacterium]
MKWSKKLKKSISAVMAVLIFLSQSVLAHFSETSLWKERQKSIVHIDSSSVGKSSLPSIFSHTPSFVSLKNTSDLDSTLTPLLAYGTIRKVVRPKNSKGTILHIQDIHQNEEAQRNIAALIEKMSQNTAKVTVGLEGAFHAIDLENVHSFEDQESVKKVATYLLKIGKISGPVFTALSHPERKIQLIGIDEKTHYHANVEAYQNIRKIKEEVENRIKQEENRLIKTRSELNNKKLIEFDDWVSRYNNKELSLGEYILTLAKWAHPQHKQTILFKEAYKAEKTLQIKKIEQERTDFIAQIWHKLSPQETKIFTTAGMALKNGDLSPSDFYGMLQGLAQKKGVKVDPQCELKKYFEYLGQSQKIKGEELFREISQLEQEIYGELSHTTQEKEYSGHVQWFRLVKKLTAFSLTREEWVKYQEKKLEIRKWKLDLNNLDLTAFERFYEEAEIRDEKMAKLILKDVLSEGKGVLSMKGLSTSSCPILVTGGFHSTGIENFLTTAGYSVISLTPKMTKVTAVDGSEYLLNAFAQEKTPLNKLFDGDKLFLAKAPIIEGSFLRALITMASFQKTKKWAESLLTGIFKGGTVVEGSDSLVKARFNQFDLSMAFGSRNQIKNLIVDIAISKTLSFLVASALTFYLKNQTIQFLVFDTIFFIFFFIVIQIQRNNLQKIPQLASTAAQFLVETIPDLVMNAVFVEEPRLIISPSGELIDRKYPAQNNTEAIKKHLSRLVQSMKSKSTLSNLTKEHETELKKQMIEGNVMGYRFFTSKYNPDIGDIIFHAERSFVYFPTSDLLIHIEDPMFLEREIEPLITLLNGNDWELDLTSRESAVREEYKWDNWKWTAPFWAYQLSIHPLFLHVVYELLRNEKSTDLEIWDLFGGDGTFLRNLNKLLRKSHHGKFEYTIIDGNSEVGDKIRHIPSRIIEHKFTTETDLAALAPGHPQVITAIGGLNFQVTDRAVALHMAKEIFKVLPEGGKFILGGFTSLLLNRKDLEDIGFEVKNTSVPFDITGSAIQLYVAVKPIKKQPAKVHEDLVFKGFLGRLEEFQMNPDIDLNFLLKDIESHLSKNVQAMLQTNIYTFNISPRDTTLLDVFLGLALYVLDKKLVGISDRQLEQWDLLITSLAQTIKQKYPENWGGPQGPDFIKIQDHRDPLYGYLSVPFLLQLALSTRFHDQASLGYDELSFSYVNLPPLYRDRVEKLSLFITGTHLQPNIYPREVTDFKSSLVSFKYALERLKEALEKGASDVKNALEWELAIGTYLFGLAYKDDKLIEIDLDAKPFLWDIPYRQNELEGNKLESNSDWVAMKKEFYDLIYTHQAEIKSSLTALKKEVQDVPDGQSWLSQRWVVMVHFFMNLPPWNHGASMESLMVGPQDYSADIFKHFFEFELKENSTHPEAKEQGGRFLVSRNLSPVLPVIAELENKLIQKPAPIPDPQQVIFEEGLKAIEELIALRPEIHKEIDGVISDSPMPNKQDFIDVLDFFKNYGPDKILRKTNEQLEINLRTFLVAGGKGRPIAHRQDTSVTFEGVLKTVRFFDKIPKDRESLVNMGKSLLDYYIFSLLVVSMAGKWEKWGDGYTTRVETLLKKLQFDDNSSGHVFVRDSSSLVTLAGSGYSMEAMEYLDIEDRAIEKFPNHAMLSALEIARHLRAIFYSLIVKLMPTSKSRHEKENKIDFVLLMLYLNSLLKEYLSTSGIRKKEMGRILLNIFSSDSDLLLNKEGLKRLKDLIDEDRKIISEPHSLSADQAKKYDVLIDNVFNFLETAAPQLSIQLEAEDGNSESEDAYDPASLFLFFSSDVMNLMAVTSLLYPEFKKIAFEDHLFSDAMGTSEISAELKSKWILELKKIIRRVRPHNNRQLDEFIFRDPSITYSRGGGKIFRSELKNNLNKFVEEKSGTSDISSVAPASLIYLYGISDEAPDWLQKFTRKFSTLFKWIGLVGAMLEAYVITQYLLPLDGIYVFWILLTIIFLHAELAYTIYKQNGGEASYKVLIFAWLQFGLIFGFYPFAQHFFGSYWPAVAFHLIIDFLIIFQDQIRSRLEKFIEKNIPGYRDLDPKYRNFRNDRDFYGLNNSPILNDISALNPKPRFGNNLSLSNSVGALFSSVGLLGLLYYFTPTILVSAIIFPIIFVVSYFIFQALGLMILAVLRSIGFIRAGPQGEYRLIRYLGYRGAIKISWIQDYFPTGATPQSHPELFALLDLKNPQSLYRKISLSHTVFLNELHPSLPNKKVILINEKKADPLSQVIAAPHEFMLFRIFYVRKYTVFLPLHWIINLLNEAIAFVGSSLASIPIFVDVLYQQRGLEHDRLAPDLRYRLKKYINPDTGGHYTEKDLEFFNGNPEVVHPLLKEETDLLGHQDPQAHQIVHLLDLTIVDPQTKKPVTVATLISEFKWDLALKAITRAVPPVLGMTARQFNSIILTHRNNQIIKDDELVGSIPDKPGKLIPVKLADGPEKIVDLTGLSPAEREAGQVLLERAFAEGKVASIQMNSGAGARFSDSKPWVPEFLTKAVLGVLQITFKNARIFSSVAALNLILWAGFVPVRAAKSFVSFLVTRDNKSYVQADINHDPLIQILGFKDQVNLSLTTAQSALPFLNRFGGVLYVPGDSGEKLWVRPLGALDAIFTHVINGDFFKWAHQGVEVASVKAGDNITVPDGNAIKILRDSGKPIMVILVDRELMFNLDIDGQPVSIKTLGNKKVISSQGLSETVRVREGRSFVYSSIKFKDEEKGEGKIILRKDGKKYFIDESKTQLPEGVSIKKDKQGAVEMHLDNNDVLSPKLQFLSSTLSDIPLVDVTLATADRQDVVFTVSYESTQRKPIPFIEEKTEEGWKEVPNTRIKIKEIVFEKGGTPFQNDIRDDHELEKSAEVDRLKLENRVLNSGEMLVHLPWLLEALGFSQNDWAHPPIQDEVLEKIWDRYKNVPPSVDTQKFRLDPRIKGHQLAWILAALLRADLDVVYAVVDREGVKTPGGYFALKESDTLKKQFEGISRMLETVLARLKEKSPEVDLSLLPPYLLAAEWTHVLFIAHSLMNGKSYWDPLPGQETSTHAVAKVVLNRKALLDHSQDMETSGLNLNAGERLLQMVQRTFVDIYKAGYKVFYQDKDSIKIPEDDTDTIEVLISAQPNNTALQTLDELKKSLESNFGVQVDILPPHIIDAAPKVGGPLLDKKIGGHEKGSQQA